MPEKRSFSTAILITGEVGAKFMDGLTKAAKRTNVMSSELKKLQATTVTADRMSAIYGRRLADQAKLGRTDAAAAAIAPAAAGTGSAARKAQTELNRLQLSGERLRKAIAGETDTLKKMNATLLASGVNTQKLRLEQVRLHGELDHLKSRAEVFARMKEGVMKLGEASRIVFEGMKRGAEVVGGIGLAGFGLFEVSKSAAIAARDTGALAKSLGMTSTELQQVRFVMGEYGISAQDTDQVLAHMIKTTAAARDGLSMEGKAFQKAGLDANSISLFSPIEQLRQLADGLSRVTDERKRGEISETLLGKGAGLQVGGALADGSTAFDEKADEALRRRVARSVAENKRIQDSAAAFEEFDQRIGALKVDAGITLMPSVLKLMGQAGDWLNRNKDRITTLIEKIGRTAVTAGPALFKLVTTGLALTQTLLGIVAVAPRLAILGAVFGPTILKLAVLTAGTERGGRAIGSLFGMLINGAGPVTGALRSIGGSVIEMVAGAEVALLPLMGWGILIGAAIGGAAFLIYKYWKPISAFFRGVWEGISDRLRPLLRQFEGLRGAAAALWRPVRLLGVELMKLTGQSDATKESLDALTKSGHSWGELIVDTIVPGLSDAVALYEKLQGLSQKASNPIVVTETHWLVKFLKWMLPSQEKGPGDGTSPLRAGRKFATPFDGGFAGAADSSAAPRPEPADLFRFSDTPRPSARPDASPAVAPITATFHLYQQPGQSAKSLAMQVHRELEALQNRALRIQANSATAYG